MNRVIAFILFVVFQCISFGQGSSCANMGPICTNVGLNFTAQTGVTDATIAEPGNNYGCLFSAPNPSWYYLEISQNGNVEMELSAPNDIDFALWGPFPDLATAQSGCGSLGAPLPNWGAFDGCSFSGSATEFPGIQNAQVGEVYIMLITNYSGTSQNISLTQTGGAGATDCSIVNPTCVLDNLTANFVSCTNTPTLSFDMGGSVTFTDPPTSGQLIVENCYGQQQVFNAPFVSPVNYTFTGLPQDGLSCNITATFTADPACTATTPIQAPTGITGFSLNQGGCNPNTNTFGINGTIDFTTPPTTGTLTINYSDGNVSIDTVINAPFNSPESWSISGLPADGSNYTVSYFFSNFAGCGNSITGTAPNGCSCTAQAGTYSANITGDGTINYLLCFGDQIDINSNNDFTPPGDQSSIFTTITYDPGVAYLVYTCPPTVLPPNQLWDNNGLPVDLCLVGVASFGNNFNSVNNTGLPPYAGGFTDNTVYYVPITTYSNTDNIYATSVNGGDWCYDMGATFAVQYLPEITTTEVEDCQNGTLTVTVNGGLPELDGTEQFTASNLLPATASFNNTTASHGGDIVISGLQDGDMYSFDITDANGCPQTITGGPFVGLPTPMAGADDTICTLTYNLNPTTSVGAVTWTGPAGVVFGNANSASTTVTVPAAGMYTFTFTESNGAGCVASDDVTVYFSNLQYTENSTDPTCGNSDGSITLTASDGEAPYSYSIDNGVTSQLAGSFNNLGAATYNVLVTDNLGCTASGTVTLSNLGGPTLNGVTEVNLNCNGVCDGEITINATSATQYSIDNGTTFTANNTFNSLCAGNYDIVIEDGVGCQVTTTATLTEPLALTNSFTTVDLNCNGVCNGEIEITANGGTGPYSYSIDNGASFSPTNLFSGLCAGNYDIIVEDDNGCTTTASTTLTEPAPLTVTLGITDALCVGQCNGSVNVIPAGGTGTYNYSWSPSTAGGNVPLISNLCPGNYDLTVTDVNGCTIDTNGIVVGAPQSVSIDNVVTIDEGCGGDCTGEITIQATGATSYSIDGNNFGASNTFSNLCAGSYNIEVQDANGCNATGTALVTGPPPVTVQTGGTTTICIGETTQITAVGAGGVGGFTYAWDNAATTQNLNVSPTNSSVYCVTATDANGCPSAISCETVTVNPPLNVVAFSDQTICDGSSAQISAIGSGGNGGPYTYTWDQAVGVGQNQTVSPATTTTYTVTVSDGCTTPDATASVTVTVLPLPAISFTGDNLSGCLPLEVNFTSSGVPAGSTCLWNFGDGTVSQDCNLATHTYNFPGCWTVSLDVTTPDGCQVSTSINDYICVYDFPVADFEFAPQPTTFLSPEIDFTNLSTGAVNYSWEIDTAGTIFITTNENPSHTFPAEAGYYDVCLTAVSSEGCATDTCKIVEILEEFVIYVPNAFTPNGNGINDEFIPVVSGIDPESYEFYIFNRWGELIFESYHLDQGWDGTYKGVVSQQDVYVWKIELRDLVGKSHTYRGHVSLIR